MTDTERVTQTIRPDDDVRVLLPAIFDRIADGVTVLDRAGTLRYANAAAARLMGYDSADEIIGQSSANMVDRFDLLDDDGRPLD